jgi:hypothetical protein
MMMIGINKKMEKSASPTATTAKIPPVKPASWLGT